jgi:ubiquinone/menaquinone biosynthesis C-methylase UbiE
LYQHPLALAVLGESWHPGGLAVTRSLAEEIKLSRSDQVLDVACGRGASTLMLAKVFQCRVTGMDTSIESIEQAQKEAQRYHLGGLVSFSRGDATCLPFLSSAFSAVFCECVTALFSDRQSAFREMARVLEPGGYLVLNDIIFRPDNLPGPLDLPLARTLCIPLATGPEAYVQLVEEAGLSIHCKKDCSGAIVQLLYKIESLLELGRMVGGPEEGDQGSFRQIEDALRCAHQLVQQSDLGYWGFIARK